jgi:hypothetical protein
VLVEIVYEANVENNSIYVYCHYMYFMTVDTTVPQS